LKEADMKAFLFLVLFAFSLNIYGQQSKLIAVKSEQGIYVDHKVQPKENWYSVGRMYAISPKDIASFNALTIDKGLNIGQALKVPLNSSNFIQATNSVGIPVYHVVQPKEGLLKIASTYGLSLDGIKSLNGLTGEQINIGRSLIIGYIGATNQANSSTGTSTSNSPSSDEEVVSSTKVSATTVNTPAQKNQPPATPVVDKPVVVVEKPKEEKPKPSTKEVEKINQPKVEKTEVKQTAASLNNYFATGFVQQAKEGKEQKLDNPKYGIFKSSSGWQDGKYYVLMNDVVPGTIVKLTATTTAKTIHAKVLGAVPPGKESEGMLLRVSNAAASALGIESTGTLSLVWYK
jgi:LysM repeat protein